MWLDNKKIVVMGGTTGLGLSAASAFVREGARVVVVGRNPESCAAAEGQLDAGLGKLFAVAEAYPQLKSDGPMIEAQRGLSEVETNIAAARRFYNSAVGDLRNATQIFPGSLLAGLAGASTPPPLYEAPEASRAPVDASK